MIAITRKLLFLIQNAKSKGIKAKSIFVKIRTACPGPCHDSTDSAVNAQSNKLSNNQKAIIASKSLGLHPAGGCEAAL